jgi:hypothetical protein
MQQHGNNRRRESRLLIGLAWLLKLEMMVDVDIATQGFLGDGFGVKGRVGVWVVVLSPFFVSHHQFLQPI